jgi:MraZ protein
VRASARNRLVITYNPFESGCLWLFPHAEWEQVRDQVNALPKVKAAHRDMQMKLVGAAAEVEPDGAARILLPASQRAAAGIEKKAVLLGMGNKFELWSEQAHLAKIRQTIGEDEITDDNGGSAPVTGRSNAGMGAGVRHGRAAIAAHPGDAG